MEIDKKEAELVFAVFNDPKILFPGPLAERIADLKRRCIGFLNADSLAETTEVREGL